MKREDLLKYVSYVLDDALAVRTMEDLEEHPEARLVGFQCGFEPLVIAVFSYLPGCRVEPEDAEDIAVDYLEERKWFSNPNEEHRADFVL